MVWRKHKRYSHWRNRVIENGPKPGPNKFEPATLLPPLMKLLVVAVDELLDEILDIVGTAKEHVHLSGAAH